MNCCVCDEEFKPGDKVALSVDGRAIVHDPKCTFLMPHHFLSSREAEAMKVKFSQITRYQSRTGVWPGEETLAEVS